MNNISSWLLAPSQNNTEFWAEVKAENLDTYENNGSWQLSILAKDLDDVWKKIANLTMKGKLGPISMTSTAKHDNFMTSSKDSNKQIFIFTKDYKDIEDISRIAWTLYTNKIFKKEVLKYKTNKTNPSSRYLKVKDTASIYSIGIRAIGAIHSQEQLSAFFKSKLILRDLPKPSKDTLNLWQTAKNNDCSLNLNANSGKWKIHVPLAELDQVWNTVASLTHKGDLGPLSKVKTVRLSSSKKDNTIVVYTKDHRDFVDISRVALTLYKQNILKSPSLEYKFDALHFVSLPLASLKNYDDAEKLADYLRSNKG